MRFAPLKIAGAAACLAAGVGILYGVLTLPLPDHRLAVVALFASGIGLSLAGGALLGQLLWQCIRRGGKWWSVLVGEGILSGVAFFGFLAAWAGHLPFDNLWAEPLVVSSAILLLTASSYALGWVLVSGGVAISPYRKLAVFAFFYGVPLAGYVLHRQFPPPWVTISPEQLTKPRRTFTPGWVDWSRAIESLIEEADNGALCVQRDIDGSEENVVEIGDLIVAEGSQVQLEEGTIEIQRVDVYTTDPSIGASDPGPTDPQVGDSPSASPRRWELFNLGSYRLHGKCESNGPPQPALSVRTKWDLPFGLDTFFVVFRVRMEGELFLDDSHLHELAFMPWNAQVGRDMPLGCFSFAGGESEEVAPVIFGGSLPVPGPLELRLVVLRGERSEHYASTVEGEFIELDNNTFRLLRILPGRFDWGGYSGPGWLRLEPVTGGVDEEVTTALFLGRKSEPTRSRVFFEAIRHDGSGIDQTQIKTQPGYIWVEFPVAPEEICQFRILERSRFTRVVFPIQDLPYFPRANHGLTNLLEMRIPQRLEHYWQLRPFLGHVVSRGPVFVNPSRFVGSNPTVRQILDHHYPAAWEIERKGAIRYTYTDPADGSEKVDAQIDFRVKRCLRTRAREALTGKPTMLHEEEQWGFMRG